MGDRFVGQIRRVAREEAHRVSPPTMRFKITKVKPKIVLEALGSDLVLTQGDDDLELSRIVKKEAEVGDICLVSTHVYEGGHTEYTAHGLI
jgi:hypothetical protein